MGLSEQQVNSIQAVLDLIESKTIRIDEMRQFVKGLLLHNEPFDEAILLNMVSILQIDARSTAQEIVDLLQ